MSTTAIFAELLVIGIQGLVWIVLLLDGLFPKKIPWERMISNDRAGLATAVAIAAAYSVGVIIDRLTDSAFHLFDRRIRRQSLPRADDDFVSKVRMEVMHGGGKMFEFLEYVRSRLRIARSTAANSIAGTIALCVFLPRSAGQKPCLVFGVALLGALVSALTFYAWMRISETYYKRLLDIWEVLEKQPARPPA